MPADAPFYQSPPYFYRDIEIMMFTYITDSKAALKICPRPWNFRTRRSRK
jgi:acetoacetate decarboxylase